MLDQLDWNALLSGGTALLALVLSLNIALNTRFRVFRKARFVRVCALLFFTLILFSVASLAEQLLDGRPGETARFLLRLACFFDFLLSGLLAFSFSGLLLAIADPEHERPRVWAALAALELLHALLVLAGARRGFLYTIDAQNVYRRGEAYGLSLISPALMLLLDIWVLLRRRGRMNRDEYRELWGILAIPFADVILQYFVQNVTPVAVVAAALLLYTMLTRMQVRELNRQQEENLRLRTEILLSEIEPHFMYNTLGAVAELCDSDPARAKETTLLFSRYLQGVLGGLRVEMVPFEEELKQLRLYLELARVRFEDALQVEYQIECADFTLPTMCLQPLVENAIRHGIRRNKGGRGRLVLRSAERADCWEITVSDDGPGPDALKKPDRESLRVGLANVGERLRLGCGGSVELRAGAGQGAVALVRIPKKREE